MSKPYFIELYNSALNTLEGKFKFVLQGTTVKEIKELIIQKLINKKQVQADDQIKIKDNDEYQLGSDDQVNDVIPDGKVKLYVNKKNVVPQVVVQPPQNVVKPPVNIAQYQPQPQVIVSQPVAQNPPVQVNNVGEINSTSNVLDLTNLKLPIVDSKEKFNLKVFLPQIRKSLIEIPIKKQFDNYLQFSEYIVSALGLPNVYKAILYNNFGCPFVYNLDLILSQFPKLDYSHQYHIIFTKTVTSWTDLPIAPMQSTSKPQIIKIVKANQIHPIDIKFDIDLSNSVNVLKYKVYQMTGIHPFNQILKFGNTVLANDLETLTAYKFKENSIVELAFKLNSNLIPSSICDKFYYKDVTLVNEQTQLSIQSLRSHMIVLSSHLKQEDQNKFLAVLQKYSENLPLVYAFKLLFTSSFLSQASRIALEEGLFTCLVNFIKGLKSIPSIKINEIFLYIRNFLGFVLDSMTKVTNVENLNKHFSIIAIQNTCTFTLKTIKSPSVVKIDDGQTLLVDKILMQEQIDKGFVFNQYKSPKKTDLKTLSSLQDVWSNFKINHLDNDNIKSLYWVGIQEQKLDNLILSQTNCEIDAYLTKIDGYQNLKVLMPLQLKNNTHRWLLVKTKENRLKVYVGTNKDVNKPHLIFSPITGEEVAVNLDLMSGATSTENTEVKIDITTLKPVITREPKQAIVVLFDISGSMGSKFFDEPDLFRIGAVKSFFEAFAYRTIAYNLEHVVSLIFFDHNIQVQCDFTQALFDFNTLIANAKPRGSTKLYDSIVLATKQLVQFGKKYPECKLRILALTDGEDNQSSYSYIDAAKMVVENNIIMDSFAVGSGCDGLKNITFATGGKCYLTRNLEESLKLFEQQTVLSVRVRSQDQLKSTLTVDQMIEKAKFKPFDEINSIHKFNVPQTKALNVNGKDLINTINSQAVQQQVSSNNSLKRIIKQIEKYTKDPHPFVSIYPSADFNFWKILLLGPKDTPYENGLFVLYAKFANDYPFKAPEVRFITPIYHCNMNSQGRICHSIFDRNYSPAISFKQIVDSIYGLILTPEPEDPLDNVVASYYLSEYPKYVKNASEATAKNASPSAEHLVQELFGNIADDIERQLKIKEISEWIQFAKSHN